MEILHQDLELITKMESLLVCICKSSFCTSVLEHGALILDFVADEVLQLTEAGVYLDYQSKWLEVVFLQILKRNLVPCLGSSSSSHPFLHIF